MKITIQFEGNEEHLNTAKDQIRKELLSHLYFRDLTQEDEGANQMSLAFDYDFFQRDQELIQRFREMVLKPVREYKTQE